MRLHRYINYLFHSTIESKEPPHVFGGLCRFQREFGKLHTENTFTVLDPEWGVAFSQRYRKNGDGTATHSQMWKHERNVAVKGDISFNELIERLHTMRVEADRWDVPDDLPQDIRLACHKILEVAKGVNDATYTGGCTPFYTPKQWNERGEEYGGNSELIVVHDGGNFSPYFSYQSEYPQLRDKMDAALEELGLYCEPCTCWYGAIYRR